MFATAPRFGTIAACSAPCRNLRKLSSPCFQASQDLVRHAAPRIVGQSGILIRTRLRRFQLPCLIQDASRARRRSFGRRCCMRMPATRASSSPKTTSTSNHCLQRESRPLRRLLRPSTLKVEEVTDRSTSTFVGAFPNWLSVMGMSQLSCPTQSGRPRCLSSWRGRSCRSRCPLQVTSPYVPIGLIQQVSA